jgi:hypothetical protein
MDDNNCDICGESHMCKYMHTLPCKHAFHYECIMKSHVATRSKCNTCPLCRTPSGFLPIVNGLSKVIRGIHYSHKAAHAPPMENSQPCSTLLKSGKRKGQECGAKCMIGFGECKRHHISTKKGLAKPQGLVTSQSTSGNEPSNLETNPVTA